MQGQRRLHVEETNILGIAGDEAAPGLDVLAHQHAEQFVGGGGVVERHRTQNRTAGSIVVSHSSLAFISPRPL